MTDRRPRNQDTVRAYSMSSTGVVGGMWEARLRRVLVWNMHVTEPVGHDSICAGRPFGRLDIMVP